MQELIFLPTGAASFTKALKFGLESFNHLKNVSKARVGLQATSVGDEGGFPHNILNNKDGKSHRM